MTARVWDDAVAPIRAYVEGIQQFYGDDYLDDLIDTADGGHGSPALRHSDLRALLDAADAVESAVKAEALAPVAALADEYERSDYLALHGVAERLRILLADPHAPAPGRDAMAALAAVSALADEWADISDGMKSKAALAGSALGFLDRLRAVLGDPDAAAKHNAAIWDQGRNAPPSNGADPTPVNPYRTTEGTADHNHPTKLAPPTQDDAQQKGTT